MDEIHHLAAAQLVERVAEHALHRRAGVEDAARGRAREDQRVGAVLDHRLVALPAARQRALAPREAPGGERDQAEHRRRGEQRAVEHQPGLVAPRREHRTLVGAARHVAAGSRAPPRRRAARARSGSGWWSSRASGPRADRVRHAGAGIARPRALGIRRTRDDRAVVGEQRDESACAEVDRAVEPVEALELDRRRHRRGTAPAPPRWREIRKRQRPRSSG